MTNREIAHYRLLNQRIAGGQFSRPAEVVQWMGAMQAQDYQQVLWAIGLRTNVTRRTDIEQAIAERKIVLTWPMRGTLHFVPAENAKWMLKFLAPRQLAADKLRLKQLELDAKILERCRQLFHHALQGGKRLSRTAMMQLLEAAQINPKGQRGYHILWYVAQEGLVCHGPMQGKEQTFVLLDEWIPDARQLSREDALAELAQCYFASRGPASINDFAGWAGLTLADARAGLESARASLVSKQGTKEYWLTQCAADHQMPDALGVYLLPGFDEYLLGYKDRRDVLAGEHARKIVPGGNGVFLPTIVIDGQVVGTWKRAFRKNTVEVTLTPFMPLGISKTEIAVAVKRFGDFIDLPLSLKAPV
ncbi:MAG: AlkZ family DNA glycosylase [Ferruginibacter sp.]|nr:AlkZ family DNA glycosylase [Cytophagales bacterium]